MVDDLGVEVAELGVPVGVLATLGDLGVGLQAEPLRAQHPGHRPVGHRMPAGGERVGEVAGRLRRPHQRRLRIPAGLRVDQRGQRRSTLPSSVELPLYARGLGFLVEKPGLVGDHHSRRGPARRAHSRAGHRAPCRRPTGRSSAAATYHPGSAHRPAQRSSRSSSAPHPRAARADTAAPGAPRLHLHGPTGHPGRTLHRTRPATEPGDHRLRPGRGHRVFFEIQHTLKLITRWPPP